MTTPYEKYRQTLEWQEIEKSIKDLVDNQDIEIKTSPDYVTGYISKHLIERKRGIMNKGNSYIYFALTGDNFDTQVITDKIGIIPTETWNKGDKGKYKLLLKYSCWKLSTAKGQEYLMVDTLVNEIVNKLFDKIEIINELKNQFQLDSVLEIVLYIDSNSEQSTPALGHDLKTIEFLYRTKTTTDLDIYRFNSETTK